MITATRDYIELIANALGESERIDMKSGHQWRTDVDKRIIEYNAVDLLNKSFEASRGLILHEIAHVLFTKNDPKEEERETVKKYTQPVMRDLYNMFEDLRIEDRINDKYEDYSEYSLKRAHVEKLAEVLYRHNYDFTAMPRATQFLMLAYVDYLIDDSEMMRQYVQRMKNIHGTFVKTAPEVLIRYKQYRPDLKQQTYDAVEANKTSDVMDIVDQRFVPIVKDWLEQDPPPPQSAAMCACGAKGNGEGEDGEGEGKDDEPKIPMDMKGLLGGKDINPEYEQIKRPTLREAQTILRPYINTLASKLKDVLKENSMSRFTGQHKAGKLLSVNAYKVLLDEKRIFSRKTNPKQPKYNVYFALDSSGSMTPHLLKNTFMGAVLVSEACKQLGMPVTLYNYESTAREMRTLDDYKDSGGGTEDIAVLDKVHEHITRNNFQEDDNLLFIITDGEPNRPADKDSSDYGRLHKDLTKKFNTQIFALGIGDGISRYFHDYYENAVVVPDVTELPLELMKLLKSIIHR